MSKPDYTLHFTEVIVDGACKGFAFHDPDTDYIRYQIAAPTQQRDTWHAIEVCRGGEDPFEFVSLGYAKTRKRAFALVRKAFEAWIINDNIRRSKKRVNDED